MYASCHSRIRCSHTLTENRRYAVQLKQTNRSRARGAKKSIPEIPNKQPTVLPFTPLAELEHLLKVSDAVAQDANKVWADIWAEFKRLVTTAGLIVPEAKDGFIPSCGWPEFLEKLWLLKHYLDSIQRICKKKH